MSVGADLMKPPISFADVEAAAARINGAAIRTPIVRSPLLDAITGATVLMKAECLQRTGSFKFRGAYNRLAAMDDATRRQGIVAASSGNHAQGVAEAARLFGVDATIVMPADAPHIKRSRTIRSGGNVVSYDRNREDRVAIANAIKDERGATFVPPFDDPFVMAGQGTSGLELAQDARALGLKIDRVLVPTSGGGLLAGIATAMNALMPGAVCQPVEPQGFDDMTRSLALGERVSNRSKSGSIADALMAETPGVLTFAVNRERARPGCVASDEDIRSAVAFAANELKLIVEPGGAAGLAALLTGAVDVSGETVGLILSGGNIDGSTLAAALAATQPSLA
ncbi:MAG: threonine/serine dehydratase [Pseudomonadota bacterium]